MKKLVLVLLSVVLLGACKNYKSDADRLVIVRDSLQQVSATRDSSIVEFLNDFNEIQANLDSIKEMQDMVSVQSDRGSELNAMQKQVILEDIYTLNDLLERNKELTASLQKKLKNSNFKIGKLEGMVSEFERMVANMEKQGSQKDAELLALADQVQQLNIDISSLNEKLEDIQMENEKKLETIETQKSELNQGYFVFGSTRELKDNAIIDTRGGFLGIGKTPVIMKGFNRDPFTEIDILNFDYLPLLAKKAQIVSVHPEGSFHISGEKSADTLFIDNSAEFWKASKYLVIITD